MSDLEANKAVVRRFISALERGADEELGGLFADNMIWRVPNLPEQNRDESISSFKRMFGTTSNRVVKEVGITAEGNRVAIQLEWHMDMSDGAVYENDFHILLKLEDGRIVFMQPYLDTLRVAASRHVTQLFDEARAAKAAN